jgi:hypothetical protein
MMDLVGLELDMQEPDFHMAGFEGEGNAFDLLEPVSCWRLRRILEPGRDDYLLIGLSFPLAITDSGEELSEVLICCRWKGDSLFPINRWPMLVNVGTFDVPNSNGRFIGIAELWKSRREADDALRLRVSTQGRW